MIDKNIVKLSRMFNLVFRVESEYVEDSQIVEQEIEIVNKENQEPLFAIYVDTENGKMNYTLSIFNVENNGQGKKYIDTSSFTIYDDMKSVMERIKQEMKKNVT